MVTLWTGPADLVKYSYVEATNPKSACARKGLIDEQAKFKVDHPSSFP